jgi:hypothetical protein
MSAGVMVEEEDNSLFTVAKMGWVAEMWLLGRDDEMVGFAIGARVSVVGDTVGLKDVMLAF